MISNRIFRGPKTLSIMPTWTCPAECKDCGTLSSPYIKQHLTLATMINTINLAKESGFHNIVFTGGEPTLRWNDLLVCIKRAKELGFPTRVVTNAHWAHTVEQASIKIKQLIDVGLDEINYSTGDEHIRFISLDKVVNAIRGAVTQNLRVYMMVEFKKERKITREIVLNHPGITSLSSEQRNLFDLSESPWMPLNYNTIEQYAEGMAINKQNIALRTGCDSILQTYVLESDGKISACCGLGMRLIPELCAGSAVGEDFLNKAITKSESDFLKLWIHYKGPEKIIEWAAEKNPDIKWENMYAHRCQACSRLYKDEQIREVIRTHYTEMYAEILQCAFLEEEYIPEKLTSSIKAYRKFNDFNLVKTVL